MEAVKCPICKAICSEQEIKDGEMFRCHYCKARFTVTKARRYSLVAQSIEKCNANPRDNKLLEEFVHSLDNERLLVLLKAAIKELLQRK